LRHYRRQANRDGQYPIDQSKGAGPQQQWRDANDACPKFALATAGRANRSIIAALLFQTRRHRYLTCIEVGLFCLVPHANPRLIPSLLQNNGLHRLDQVCLTPIENINLHIHLFTFLSSRFAFCRNLSHTVVMIKRMISFTEPQDDWLNKEAERLGISVAELVRRIIDWYREPQSERKQSEDAAS
jgi:hypothetical protein